MDATQRGADCAMTVAFGEFGLSSRKRYMKTTCNSPPCAAVKSLDLSLQIHEPLRTPPAARISNRRESLFTHLLLDRRKEEKKREVKNRAEKT